MKNLILIGMPGAGKSTVGVVLAKQQGYHFVDSDLVIQEQTGLLLHEIIEQQGDDGFRQVENRINADLAVKHSVIATGGSVIYGQKAAPHRFKLLFHLSCPLLSLRQSCHNLCNNLPNTFVFTVHCNVRITLV